MSNPRALSATPDVMNDSVERAERSVQSTIQWAAAHPDTPHYGLFSVPRDLTQVLLKRYARGDSLASLRAYFEGGYRTAWQQAADVAANMFPEHRLRCHFEQSGNWMQLFAIVCFDDDGVANLDHWITPDCNPVLYAMVRKALSPSDIYAHEPVANYTAMPHEEQLVSALLQPASTWPKAFAAYMKQWPRLMKKYGYREQIDAERSPFEYFPLHLGLAVCAFDVDDSSFRHLPYYPHELVDYYRANMRHTRDAWRTHVSDPAQGLPKSARPQPKKTYTLSKAEASTRWLELVCGEQPALIDAARKALGKRKTMPDIDPLTQALAAAGLAIHADLKDDETVTAQMAALCASWQTPVPAIAGTAQQGPARITIILNALHGIDAAQDPRLAVLGDGGDNWNALFYSSDHEAEFTSLSEQLGIKRMEPSQWQ